MEEANLRTWRPERMFLPTPSWFRFYADVKKLDDYVSSLIVKRWELRLEEKKSDKKERKDDILDKLLNPIQEEEWNSEVVRQIRDEVKTFVLAGHETSASMLTWSLYELLVNKECMETVQQEATILFNKTAIEDIPTRTDMEVLLYTECALRESLRKYSVVPSVVRVANESIELGEYHIEKGATLMLNIQGVHHDPQYWPEPLAYKPERFLSEIIPYTFMPFIDGPRMCLGQYLSILESKLVLAWLVHNYSFELVDKEEASQKHPFMIPVTPKIGHFMIIK